MARHSRKLREEARQLYLTGEVTSVSEIARRVKVKPHTIGMWKREENWDGLRIKIDKRAAEQLVERLATEKTNLNATHYKLWQGLVARVYAELGKGRLGTNEIRDFERVASILEKAQKGQRLARGLSLDGETEETIRAQAAAETRHVVDTFLRVVNQEVADPVARDRIAKAVLELVPAGTDEDEETGT
jgi:chorismate mutase